MRKKRFSIRQAMILYAFAVLLVSNSITGFIYYILRNTPELHLPAVFRLAAPVCLFLISLGAGTLAAYGISKYYLRPVEELTRASERIAQGDFSVQVGVVGYGETSTLLRTFNTMAAKLSSSQMFRSDFINSFSHEIKTPIVSILGFARQLEREDISPEQRREYAAIIAAESQRLSRLASNILRLSSLENSEPELQRAPFRLDEQLRRCILLLENQWTDKRLALDVELEDVTYTGDSDLLSEVWVNLLNNAIKFTPAGGSIYVRLIQTPEAAVVTIRDTGIGMDQTTLEHMFEKFFQGAPSHSFDGTGLGLALVKRIVQLSGGEVSAQSVPGEGSVFTVRLSMKDPPENKPN